MAHPMSDGCDLPALGLTHALTRLAEPRPAVVQAERGEVERVREVSRKIVWHG